MVYCCFNILSLRLNIFQKIFNNTSLFFLVKMSSLVRCCKEKYTSTEYEQYFKYFKYPLSDFQKYSIEAIIKGKDSLVVASTGSGKSTSAEFAIQYFKKKVIYLSPIKAL